MARVNIDDSLFSDGPFIGLVSLLGDEEKAMGKVLKAFRTAQSYWVVGKLIPEGLWAALRLEELIQCDLAERRPEGIYVRGSEKAFDWLIQKKKAGEESGRIRKSKMNGNEQRSNNVQATFEHNTNTTSIVFEQNGNESEPLNSLLFTPFSNKKEKDDVTPDDIIDLFNSVLANKGRVNTFNFHHLPNEVVQDLIITSGFPEFRKKDQWAEYFKLAATRERILSYPATISFLVKYKNAVEILSGGYQDKQIDKKYAGKPSGEAQSMANRIFDLVIRNGMHGLKDTLTSFSQVEVAALEKFGRASEILTCSDFESTQIKSRLKEACTQALSTVSEKAS